MNRHIINPPCAVLATILAGCTPPHKDIPLLTKEVDAVVIGHYGQAMHHEEMAEEKLEEANKVLNHWKNDYYWNIEEGQKAVDAAREASRHRLESEKELCKWITVIHSQNHHMSETAQHAAAYFRTGSAMPYSTDHDAISTMGRYLQTHPDASADIVAYTDTVGSKASNQNLAERRAATVVNLLVEHGAKQEQLHVKAVGESEGPDNAPNQQHRVVMMSTTHPRYEDCPALK